jgi:DNA-binding LacI/PurR family transcriptional regulator
MKENSGKPITTRDIAEKAGVNQSTVSRALRNDPSVSEKMRATIRSVADELGYRPNPFVSAFTAQVRGYRRSPQHASIGILNAYRSDDQMSFLQSYTQGAVERAEQLGFRVDHFDFQKLEYKERRLLQILRTRGILGLLVLPLPTHVDLSELDVEHLACATIDLSGNLPDISHAVPDYFRHMQTALARLQELGYKRIGFCTKRSELQGFAQYSMASYLLWQQQVPVRSRLMAHVDPSSNERQAEDRAGFFQWLEKNKPDVVVSNDIRFMQWMKGPESKCPRRSDLPH